MKKIYLLFVMLTLALGVFAQSKGKNAMTLRLVDIKVTDGTLVNIAKEQEAKGNTKPMDMIRIYEGNVRAKLDEVAKASGRFEISDENALEALTRDAAVDRLQLRPQHLLIDGNRFKKYRDIPHTTVVKGDGKYLSIAAASILAKTYRDDYMNRLHEEFPYYDWNHNKGYPTKKHRAAIAVRGTTPYHRMTFNLLGGGQLELPFL